MAPSSDRRASGSPTARPDCKPAHKRPMVVASSSMGMLRALATSPTISNPFPVARAPPVKDSNVTEAREMPLSWNGVLAAKWASSSMRFFAAPADLSNGTNDVWSVSLLPASITEDLTRLKAPIAAEAAVIAGRSPRKDCVIPETALSIPLPPSLILLAAEAVSWILFLIPESPFKTSPKSPENLNFTTLILQYSQAF